MCHNAPWNLIEFKSGTKVSPSGSSAHRESWMLSPPTAFAQHQKCRPDLRTEYVHEVIDNNSRHIFYRRASERGGSNSSGRECATHSPRKYSTCELSHIVVSSAETFNSCSAVPPKPVGGLLQTLQCPLREPILTGTHDPEPRQCAKKVDMCAPHPSSLY